MPLVATEDLDPSVPPGARWTVWRDLALCALVVCAVALIVDLLVVASPRGKVRIGAAAAAVVVVAS